MPSAPRPIAVLRRLLPLALLAAWPAGPAAAVAPLSVAAPPGFEALTETQDAVVDFVAGGRAVGQFEVRFSPGRLRIRDPQALVAALPGVADRAAVLAALSGEIDPGARFLCDADRPSCARPEPAVAAVVFDARRFRAEVWLNPRVVAISTAAQGGFLSPPGHRPTLVDTVAAAVAGGAGTRADYDVRNRAILGLGAARLGIEQSWSSGRGLSLDTAAASLDRPGLRLSAGLFTAAGADLIGRRRILGAGIASQFDTRTDRDALTGTPLVVFLPQRARVDLYADGRLVSSRSYDAGNQALDTAALPEGSFPVEIRIQEVGGASRIERRFFTKDAGLPPPGRTVFHADAGLIAADRPGSLVSVGGTPLLTAGAARRIGTRLAWDAAVMATDRRALAELGASWFTPAFRVRAAVLAADTGAVGALLTAGSASGGRFGYTLDVRHVGGTGARPLIPLDVRSADGFSLSDASTQALRTAGRYTQLTGAVFWQAGAGAQLGASGYLRRDRGDGNSYAFGPTVHWTVLRRGPVQLGFDGSWAWTDRGRSLAAGLHLQLVGRRGSLSAGAGAQTVENGDGRRVRGIAELGGAWQRDLGPTRLNATAAVQDDGAGTVLQAGGDLRGPAGTLTGTLVRRVGDGASATQYGFSGQTTLAAAPGALAVGARDGNESAILVRLRGRAAATRFEVLLNDAPAGVIRPGGDLTLSVAPYRRYTVRLRPLGGALVAYDARARQVDAFPGTAAALRWTADPVLAMFGRLVRPDGTPVANADLSAPGDAVAASDDAGWFQIQAAGDASLSARTADGRRCRAQLAAPAAGQGFSALGTVVCRP